MDNTENKELFLSTFRKNVQRPGAEKLLAWMETTDFFTAPASTRFHAAYEGGLLDHSMNVYNVLISKHFDPASDDIESFTIVSLLHDLCKAGFYKTELRNRKNDRGEWEKVPVYTVDDQFPYGHGEKSVYILSGYFYGDARLTREEAFAIRYHMGFSGVEDKNTIGRALEMYPLALALNVADMEASYYLEGSEN